MRIGDLIAAIPCGATVNPSEPQITERAITRAFSSRSMPGRHNRSIDGRAAESAARSIVGEKREARRPTMLKKLKIMSLAGHAIAMGAGELVPAPPRTGPPRHTTPEER